MKKVLLFLVLFFGSIGSFSQSNSGKYTLDSLYDNSKDFLLYSAIGEYPEVKREVLVKRVKNWGGIKFVNAKMVVVSETEDQIVYNYIDNGAVVSKSIIGPYSLPWYIRLVVEFKDGKLRAQYFDDGEAISSTTRTLKLKDYFKEVKGEYILKDKRLTNPLRLLRASLKSNYQSMNDAVSGKNKDDW